MDCSASNALTAGSRQGCPKGVGSASSHDQGSQFLEISLLRSYGYVDTGMDRGCLIHTLHTQ